MLLKRYAMQKTQCELSFPGLCVSYETKQAALPSLGSGYGYVTSLLSACRVGCLGDTDKHISSPEVNTEEALTA